MTLSSSAPAKGAPTASAFTGMLLMTGGMMILPAMDGTAKYLAHYVSPVQVSFIRFLLQGVFALAIALIMGRSFGSMMKEFDRGQMLRGLFLAIGSLFFFSAVKYMPLADAIAIFFVQPMILTMLSAVFLKEQVGVRRWSAVGIGLIGALIIIRPGSNAIGLYSLLPLIAATSFAIYLMLTRKLSGTASLLGTQFTTGFTGAFVLGPLVLVSTLFGFEPAAWTTPALELVPLFLLVGAISLVSHGLIVMAFERAPASVLAPLNYVEIVSATLIGFIVFGDVPEPIVWCGVALIAGGGIYIAHRERVTAKREAGSG
ncbi:DMT family transporter [Pseudovibrio sp. SPO723]|uniref:DMT family transporter n=1 Tax=Nesiotobacter zosterae TaxID=392721 RepID=UPI0029C4FAE6|nr:DMT family transporter [Pseudovibrio sp. SPO723]MDX5592970.1 DMT family transporter [Pseudovibrio sp. SPO723]